MGIKQTLIEIYNMPDYLVKEMGFLKAVGLWMIFMFLIGLIYFNVFEWIGIHPLFSIPFILAHHTIFMYYAFYKQFKKQDERQRREGSFDPRIFSKVERRNKINHTIPTNQS